jgi:hypothetical protein
MKQEAFSPVIKEPSPDDSLRGKFSLLIATRDKLKFLFHDIANGLGATTHHWRRRILL